LCGRPKGRLPNPAVTAEGVRLAQLEAGVFEGGSPVPTAGDYAFLAGVRTRSTGPAVNASKRKHKTLLRTPLAKSAGKPKAGERGQVARELTRRGVLPARTPRTLPRGGKLPRRKAS
jgi:hypothetical protein